MEFNNKAKECILRHMKVIEDRYKENKSDYFSPHGKNPRIQLLFYNNIESNIIDGGSFKNNYISAYKVNNKHMSLEFKIRDEIANFSYIHGIYKTLYKIDTGEFLSFFQKYHKGFFNHASSFLTSNQQLDYLDFILHNNFPINEDDKVIKSIIENYCQMDGNESLDNNTIIPTLKKLNCRDIKVSKSIQKKILPYQL